MLARLVGIQLTTAMVILGIPPLTPAWRDEFALSRGGAGLLVTAASLGIVVGSWPGGRVVDAIGVRRSMMWTCVGLSASLAATGFASTYVLLLILLFIVGLFYSPVTPATNAGVVAWATARFRTRAMAIKQMGVTTGAAISAALIPLLTARYGWRWGAVAVGGIAIVVGVLSASSFHRPQRLRSIRQRGPLENRNLVIALGIAAFLWLFVQHCVSTHYILALQDEGVTLVAAGAALSLLQVAATGARFGWAWVADRWLRGDAALGLLILGFASAGVLAAMTFLDLASSPALAAILLGVTTQAGNGLIQTVLAAAGGESPASSTGVGMALGFLGPVVGPPVFGFLADWQGYQGSWIFISVVSLACGALAWQASRSTITERRRPTIASPL